MKDDWLRGEARPGHLNSLGQGKHERQTDQILSRAQDISGCIYVKGHRSARYREIPRPVLLGEASVHAWLQIVRLSESMLRVNGLDAVPCCEFCSIRRPFCVVNSERDCPEDGQSRSEFTTQKGRRIEQT